MDRNVLLLVLSIAALIVLWIIFIRMKEWFRISRIQHLLNDSPKTFLLRKFIHCKKPLNIRKEFKLLNGYSEITGIYLIYNYDKNKWYVGQGVKAVGRCIQHFTGSKDNAPQIKKDYLRGDLFFVNFIGLNGSGFRTIDELEYYYIEKYDCVKNGYNHIKGHSTNKKR